MSQPEEVLACEHFMLDVVHFILPIEQRGWAVFDYSVSPEEFAIKINFEKEKFEHKVGELTGDIIQEAQKSDLYRYAWAVHWPLCEEIEDASSCFLHSIVITIPVN